MRKQTLFCLLFFFKVCNQAKTEGAPARDGDTVVMSSGSGWLSCCAQFCLQDSFCSELEICNTNNTNHMDILPVPGSCCSYNENRRPTDLKQLKKPELIPGPFMPPDILMRHVFTYIFSIVLLENLMDHGTFSSLHIKISMFGTNRQI